VAAGLSVPAVPGILPIVNFAQVRRFARHLNTSITHWLDKRFDGLHGDIETQRLIGAAVAIEQADPLRRERVTEFHFCTLNRANLSYAICHALGVRPGRAELGA